MVGSQQVPTRSQFGWFSEIKAEFPFLLTSWKDHDLFFQLLFRKNVALHDIIQLLQRQLGVEHGDLIRVRAHRPLERAVQVQEDVAENLRVKRGTDTAHAISTRIRKSM